MSEVKRYNFFADGRGYGIKPADNGDLILHADYEALKSERDALLAQCAELRAIQEAQIQEWKAQGAALELMAGAMLDRSLDSGSKQAVAYADCADMVAKFAARLRAGEEG